MYATRTARGGLLLPLAWVIIGAFVAAAHSYFTHVDQIKGIASALLAIFAWPLVLLGVNLHIT